MTELNADTKANVLAKALGTLRRDYEQQGMAAEDRMGHVMRECERARENAEGEKEEIIYDLAYIFAMTYENEQVGKYSSWVKRGAHSY